MNTQTPPAIASVEMARALDIADLHDRMTTLRAEQKRADYQLACLLVAFDERCGFEGSGCIDTVDYGRRELELRARKTRELLRIGRTMHQVPVLRQAFADGELGYSKMREVTRVAVQQTQHDWLERARLLTCRELEAEVVMTQHGDPPPDYDDMGPPEPARVLVRFEMVATDAVVVRRALALAQARAGGNVEQGVLLADMARALVAGDVEGGNGARYKVMLQECPKCSETTHVGHEKDRCVDPAVAAEAACDSDVVDMRPGPQQGHLSRAIPPAVRRQVEHRDRDTCAVPGCGGQTWLDVHHILARSEGGGHHLDNLALTCGAHHRALHRGELFLERVDGVLHVTHRPPLAAPDDGLGELALEMLACYEAHPDELARALGQPRPVVRRLLEWYELQGKVVRLPHPRGSWALAPSVQAA